ncbi:hypothetical protein EMCRGX_G019628 [Ephydatia muelleri]
MYFASLKRSSKMVLAGKLDESKKRLRKVQRKHNKAHSRKNACPTSKAIAAEEKNEATKILTVDFMTSEETGQESAGSDNERRHQLPFSKFVHFLCGATGRIPSSPAWTERPSAGAQIKQRRCAASGTMVLSNCLHLLLGNYKAHMTGDESKRIVDENCNSELIFIPAGCTSLVPPMDVLVNRPFKQHMRDLWVKWFSNHTQRTVHGNPKTPSRQDVINWVSAAWDSIKSDTIQEFSYSVASLTGCISSLLSQPANEY